MANIKFKLFVHGVPSGQDIWGNPSFDKKYIEAFYGRKSSVASQMFVEIMQYSGETNAYYTFYYNDSKLQEHGGRTGGYFALTLRINYYYTDIPNIYNLLEASFNKYIIGRVLANTPSGGLQFMVSQLRQEDETLNALEKEVEHYLMQFSNNEDFVSLTGFKSNGQNIIQTFNLLEAVPVVVKNIVKSTGKISVSSLLPTSKEQQIINQKNTAIQAVKDDAQKQILAAEENAKKQIQALRDNYKDTDKTIDTLKKKKDQLTSRVSDLAKEAQDYKSKYYESQKELERLKEFERIIKKNLTGLSEISDLLGGSHGGKKWDEEPSEHSFSFESFIKKIHPFMSFIVMLVILCFIGVHLVKSCDSVVGWFPSSDDKDNVVEQNDTQEDEIDLLVPTSEFQQSQQSLTETFPDAKIDVEGISKTNPMTKGLKYRVSLQNVNGDLQGNWVSEDFDIENEYVTPKHAGECTLMYILGGNTIATRKIIVKE